MFTSSRRSGAGRTRSRSPSPPSRGPRVKVEVAHGGQSVIVATPDGSHFQISLTAICPDPALVDDRGSRGGDAAADPGATPGGG